MTSTSMNLMDDSLNESWVELNCTTNEGSLGGTGSILSGNMEKLLWEAQRESSHSSRIGSRISSRRDSPKSPPNSPASERASTQPFLILSKVPPNCDRQVGTDWVWDWSSRPDQAPPKDWKFKHPVSSSLSLRHSKVAKRGLFSTEVLSVLVLTNIISLLLGAGIGLFLGKRFSNSITRIPLD